MDVLTIIAIALIVLLVVGWIFYNWYTTRIIDDLISENSLLRLENTKLTNWLLDKQAVIKCNRALTKDEIKAINKALSSCTIDFPNSQVQEKPREDKNRCY